MGWAVADDGATMREMAPRRAGRRAIHCRPCACL
jgi:hypothetical protein